MPKHDWDSWRMTTHPTHILWIHPNWSNCALTSNSAAQKNMGLLQLIFLDSPVTMAVYYTRKCLSFGNVKRHVMTALKYISSAINNLWHIWILSITRQLTIWRNQSKTGSHHNSSRMRKCQTELKYAYSTILSEKKMKKKAPWQA